jgi:hypothetical protein
VIGSKIGSIGDAEGHVQTRRQGIKLFVDGPQHSVRSEQDGGEQRHIDRPAAQVLKLLPFYKGKRLVGRRDDGLLQLLVPGRPS